MDELAAALAQAIGLLLRGDAELWRSIGLSLQVSLLASAIAFGIGAPAGAALAAWRWRCRGAVLVTVNAMLGLPPVVVGLAVYLLLSRAGPLGGLGLLFTPAAMVVAQVMLALPIVLALTHRTTEPLWASFGDALRVDGASPLMTLRCLLAMARAGLVTVFLAAFGRAIAEVGAIMLVGGNIRGHTRTMTTSVLLLTSEGDLPAALAFGLVLVGITLSFSALVFLLERPRRA